MQASTAIIINPERAISNSALVWEMLLVIINDQGNCVENTSNFVDSAMSAADLTPLGAKPPAGQAITKCLMRSARDQHEGLERRL